MKYIPSIIIGLIAGVFFFFIGKGIGLWYVDVLKETGGVVTASEMISCIYILPIVMGIAAACIAYKLNQEP